MLRFLNENCNTFLLRKRIDILLITDITLLKFPRAKLVYVIVGHELYIAQCNKRRDSNFKFGY